MGVVRLFRSKLTPEEAEAVRALPWPGPEKIASVTVSFTDGTGFRLVAPIGREMVEILRAITDQAASGTPTVGVVEKK